MSTHDTTQPLAGHGRAIVSALLRNGPQSRTELSAALDLSAGSLTRLSKPLLEDGIIVETPTENVMGIGRPSVPLTFHHDAYRFIGIKLTKTHVYGALTRADAEIEQLVAEPLDASTPDAALTQVARIVAELEELSPVRVHAIGVAIGGHVRDRRLLTYADHLGWSDIDLAGALENLTGITTVVENDILAHMQATHWFGEGRGTDSFALFTIGAGIGSGLVAHGEIVSSPDAGYSLMSHFPLETRALARFERNAEASVSGLFQGAPATDATAAGLAGSGGTAGDSSTSAAGRHVAATQPGLFEAECGHHACATAMLTLQELELRASRVIGRPVSFDQLMGLAAAGDPQARGLLDASGYALGTMFAAIANLTLAGRIVLGGEACELASVSADAVNRGLHDHRDHRAADPEIRVQDPNLALWTRGAAVIAMHDTLLGRD